MTDQTQVAQTSQNVTVEAVKTFVTAEQGRYRSCVMVAQAAALLQQERNKEGLALLSSRTAAERVTDAFIDALSATGAVTDKTVRNLRTDFTKLADYAIKRICDDKSITTLAVDEAFISAEYERIEGFKPSVQALSAALTLAKGGGARKSKAKGEASNDDAAQEAVQIKADATAQAKWTGLVKGIAAMFADAENHATILADDSFRDVVALYMKLDRENSRASGEDQTQAA